MEKNANTQQLYRLLGKIERIEERIKRMESNLEFMRSALNEDGKQIAEISERCRLRGKQISQLVQRVGGCEEITGVFKLQDKYQERNKHSYRYIVTTIISVIAIMISIVIWLLSR